MQPITLTNDERQELVATRRDLHAHPELAFEEIRTSGVVRDRLVELGYTPKTGIAKTGVTTLLEGRSPGPCVLLRADMDALPIHERTGLPYASTSPGHMHACGHDAHTAILLGVARVMKRLDPLERGAIKFLFQPAEETGAGAKKMIEEGVLEEPRVDAAFGVHVWSGVPTGKVGVTPGPFMAAVDEFTIHVEGRGGHGAEPQNTADPVVAAAHLITALQQIVSRNVDPLQSAVVTVGRVEAGRAFNVIPDTATLIGTMRCFDPDVWEALPGHLERIAIHTAQACGCEARVDLKRVNQPTVNDPDMAALVHDVATELVGADNVMEARTLGGEDFGDFLARVPGCFFFVGSGNDQKKTTYPHHSPFFDVDEDALALSATLLAHTAKRYLERSH